CHLRCNSLRRRSVSWENIALLWGWPIDKASLHEKYTSINLSSGKLPKNKRSSQPSLNSH
ncbi:MAG: hypothetical protein LBG86_01460, partial [Puniceicoccales bacterium]|nr:hypothetical protein [Puniceicoccales bacterium]